MSEKKKKSLKKEHFEVLLEDIDKKVSLVLEGHEVLDKKIDDLAVEMKERDEHLEFLIHAVDRKVDTSRKELKAEIGGLRVELKEEISDVRTELKSEISDLRTDLKQEISEKVDGAKAELKQEICDVKSELGSKLDKVLEKVEDHEIRITALEQEKISSH